MELHTLTGNAILEISIVACICLILAVVILLGKGDWLIAGYNTASKEDKEKCIMPRLRDVIVARSSTLNHLDGSIYFFSCRWLDIG